MQHSQNKSCKQHFAFQRLGALFTSKIEKHFSEACFHLQIMLPFLQYVNGIAFPAAYQRIGRRFFWDPFVFLLTAGSFLSLQNRVAFLANICPSWCYDCFERRRERGRIWRYKGEQSCIKADYYIN